MEQEDTKPDCIYYTTKWEVLEEVVKKTDEVKKSDLLKSDFVTRLAVYITNKTGLVMVSFGKDKKLNGCMVVSRHLDKLGEYVWIDFAWISPHSRYMRKKYEDEIYANCKLRGIKRIQARMNRGFKAMEKLDGVKEVGRIIEKEVI